MNGPNSLYERLKQLDIPFEYYEHPEAPTVEIARQYWNTLPQGMHCKNLFFRNHKGNQHYLVCFDCERRLNIQSIEQLLRQGKLSFASPERMQTYLGLTPGSVSPFGLIQDTQHHVHVFLDKHLIGQERISFHPCINTASLVISHQSLERFLNANKNPYQYIDIDFTEEYQG